MFWTVRSSSNASLLLLPRNCSKWDPHCWALLHLQLPTLALVLWLHTDPYYAVQGWPPPGGRPAQQPGPALSYIPPLLTAGMHRGLFSGLPYLLGNAVKLSEWSPKPRLSRLKQSQRALPGPPRSGGGQDPPHSPAARPPMTTVRAHGPRGHSAMVKAARYMVKEVKSATQLPPSFQNQVCI